jgi:ABC-type glycerol-3-phosphate transport system substrate-binding protein
MRRRSFVAGGLALPFVAAGVARAQGQQAYKGQHITALLEGHPTSSSMQAMLPEFQQATGIEVTLEIVPYSDLTSKALLAYSSNSNRYDIVHDDWVHGVGYAAANYIQPVGALAEKLPQYFDKSDLVPRFFDTLAYKGETFGLPVYGESTFLMYRKDLFAAKGLAVPTTFDEMAEAAAKLKDGRLAGITLRGEQGIQNVYIWAAFLWGFGGEWLANGKSQIASPEAEKALVAYADILRRSGPPGVANFGWQENRLLFQQGRAAMTIDATVNGAFNEDPSQSTVVGKVGYATVPKQNVTLKGSSSSLAVHGLYISKATKSPEAAWLFASWATARQQQIKSVTLNPNCGVSSLGAMASKEFMDRYGSFKDGMLAAINAGNQNYLPNIPQANSIINNTGIAVSQALAGTASAKDALAAANAKNDQALAG